MHFLSHTSLWRGEHAEWLSHRPTGSGNMQQIMHLLLKLCSIYGSSSACNCHSPSGGDIHVVNSVHLLEIAHDACMGLSIEVVSSYPLGAVYTMNHCLRIWPSSLQPSSCLYADNSVFLQVVNLPYTAYILTFVSNSNLPVPMFFAFKVPSHESLYLWLGRSMYVGSTSADMLAALRTTSTVFIDRTVYLSLLWTGH